MDIKTIKNKIVPILERHDFVVRAAVYGSYARGDPRHDSDVDLYLEYLEGTSLLDVSGLGLDLEEALGIKVDMATPNSLKPAILERVLAEKVDIYEQPERHTGRYSRVLRDDSRLYERPGF